MTSTKRSLPAFLVVIALVLAIFAGLVFVLPNSLVSAETEQESQTYAYYYDHLTTTENGKVVEYKLAKQFYRALEEINNRGDFIKGKVSYPIGDIVSSDLIKAWVESGDLTVPKAFSAARDSFLMDHPELFYVDLYKLTISAGRQNGAYLGYIDSGRSANVYRDNGFTTESQVNRAIDKFNAVVNDIVNNVKNLGNDFLIAKEVNVDIARNTEYDYSSYNDMIEGEDNVSMASMTFTSYGALVTKKAVCAGYASAYKVVLDRLNIPCVIVSGYSKGKDANGNDTSGTIGHSWNYVFLETADKDAAESVAVVADNSSKKGEWFAFDTTWNSTNKKGDINKFTAMDAQTASQQHIPNGVISSSEYELTYPPLSMLTYEQANNPNNLNENINFGGFKYSSSYTLSESGNSVTEYVSYNGYNSDQLLEKEGLRLINRIAYFVDGKLIWSDWTDAANWSKYDGSGIFNETGTSFGDITAYFISSNIRFSQYAIVRNLEPDKDIKTPNGTVVAKNIYYSDSAKVEENAEFISMQFENKAYGTYTPAPYVVTEKTVPYIGTENIIADSMCEPGNSNMMADKFAITYTIVYDEPLHILDPTQPVKINYHGRSTNVTKYSGMVPFSDGQYVHLIEDENGVLNTLQFKFKPSLMYEHNREGYYISFENIGSAKIVEKKMEDGRLVKATSDKAPNHVYLVFGRVCMACPKIFGDGRLWINCCAQPTLVSNSNLADMNFEDENGTLFSESERSQMMLVAEKVSPQTEDEIINGISDSNDNNINKTDIKASQTFDISLQICGKISKIPDGSHVQIALGFPDGYGPEDEGVTFKIFHRKHVSGNNYIIEEIPCVVTKFGIVATVTSFSPYTVVVVDADKVTDKTIVASVEGNGGKLTDEDTKIQTVEKDSSYTYTITPDEGFEIYSIKLNGKNVKDRLTTENKLTVNYGEMDTNNELDVMFIASEAAERFEEQGIVEIDKIVAPIAPIPGGDGDGDIDAEVPGPGDGNIKPITPSPDSKKPLNGAAIACIVCGTIAMFAIAIVVGVIITKKKKA